ncbi:MAG: phage portal protein [Defluviitaleaceae bacterium]|nr:phage portal protein [Defluviitaleaceae bacterium]
MVSMLPIKLYNANGDTTAEVEKDNRIKILNNETGDTLDAAQFWRAIIADYFLGKGGYSYIGKQRNKFASLHYVDESQVVIIDNNEPIFKDFNLQINGMEYKPYEFLKILRNTKNGAFGKSIIDESPLILSAMHGALLLEKSLMQKGGGRKGFLKAQKKVTEEVLAGIKAAWRRLYSEGEENVVVLNDGLEFQEASQSAVEMQLNESISTFSMEIAKLFGLNAAVIEGRANRDVFQYTMRTGVMPVLRAIECALNRDFLLESEKDTMYFAFDTREMLKGSIKERYDAYRTALNSKFLKINEVRKMENLPALPKDFMELNLGTVFYDFDKETIYTPNTNQTANLRAKNFIQCPKTGQMMGSKPNGANNNVDTQSGSAYNQPMGMKKGERHYNEYLNMTKMTDGQLERAAVSYEKNILEHRDKISSPEKYVTNWMLRDGRYQLGLLRKWENEIQQFEEKLTLARYLINERM